MPTKPKKEPPKALELARQVPEDIANLLGQFKGQEKLSDDDEDKLFSYLMAQEDILSLVTAEPFKFTKRDYGRLNKAMSRKGAAKKRGEPIAEIDRVSDFKKREFLRQLAESSWEIGTDVMMKWVQRASELGYYDEAAKKVDMARFVNDAIEFFILHGEEIAELEATALANRGMAAMLAEAVGKLSSTIILVDTQLDRLEKSYPQLHFQLIPLRVLTNIERYKPERGG
jgi:hypothetical protein